MKKLILFLMIAAAFLLPGTVFAEPDFTSPDQLANATFAILTGTTCGPDTEASFPDAKIDYYNSVADILAVLRAGKADATVIDWAVARFMQ